jgi:hypothetical protein
MAISDVLWEAEKSIEEYLQGEMYSEPELRAKVLAVLQAMRSLREELDTPPSAGPQPARDHAAILNTPIDEIEWPEQDVRIFNALRNDGINTIGDLILKTERELLRLPNFGRRSVQGAPAARVRTVGTGAVSGRSGNTRSRACNRRIRKRV